MKHLIAIFMGLFSISVRAELCKPTIIVLTSEELKSTSNQNRLSSQWSDQIIPIKEELFDLLKKSGRIYEVDNQNETNCIGGICD